MVKLLNLTLVAPLVKAVATIAPPCGPRKSRRPIWIPIARISQCRHFLASVPILVTFLEAFWVLMRAVGFAVYGIPELDIVSREFHRSLEVAVPRFCIGSLCACFLSEKIGGIWAASSHCGWTWWSFWDLRIVYPSVCPTLEFRRSYVGGFFCWFFFSPSLNWDFSFLQAWFEIFRFSKIDLKFFLSPWENVKIFWFGLNLNCFKIKCVSFEFEDKLSWRESFWLVFLDLKLELRFFFLTP